MSGMSVRSPAKPRRLSRGRGETAWFTARSSIAPSISHMLYEIRRFERLNRRRDRGTRKNEDDCRNLQKSACNTRQRLSVSAVAICSLYIHPRICVGIKSGNDAAFPANNGHSNPWPSSRLAAAVSATAAYMQSQHPVHHIRTYCY